MHPLIGIAVVLALGTLVLGRLLPNKGNPAPLANRLAYQIGAVGGTVLLTALAVLAPDASKAVAVAVGTVAGLGLALAVEWPEWPPASAMAARIGALTLLLAASCLVWPDAIVRSYALAGLTASLGACHLVAVFYDQARIGTGGLLGASLLGLGAMSWLPRLLQPATTAPAVWLLALAAVALGTAAGAWAWPGRPAAAALLGGAAACLVTALAPRYTGLGSAPSLAWATVVGSLLSVGVGAIPERQRQHGLGAIALGLLAVLAVMAALRLGGSTALVFFGLGIVPVLGMAPAAWGTALLTVVGGRAVLQLWLDRTSLTAMGLDLTHPYGFAGLIAGCLAVVVTARAHQRFQARRIVLLPLAWGMLTAPLLVGYLLHVEPLGTYVTGLLTVAIVWGLLGQTEGPDPTGRLAPPLTGTALGTALITGPWLVGQINAPRAPRVAVFLVALGLVVAFALAATRRTPQRVDPTDD